MALILFNKIFSRGIGLHIMTNTVMKEVGRTTSPKSSFIFFHLFCTCIYVLFDMVGLVVAFFLNNGSKVDDT